MKTLTGKASNHLVTYLHKKVQQNQDWPGEFYSSQECVTDYVVALFRDEKWPSKLQHLTQNPEGKKPDLINA